MGRAQSFSRAGAGCGAGRDSTCPLDRSGGRGDTDGRTAGSDTRGSLPFKGACQVQREDRSVSMPRSVKVYENVSITTCHATFAGARDPATPRLPALETDPARGAGEGALFLAPGILHGLLDKFSGMLRVQ
jgi:hypothetical protein